MSVEEYESLGARFFGLIFKDATVYPAVRKKAAELGLPCVMLSEYQQAEAKEAGLVDAAMALAQSAWQSRSARPSCSCPPARTW
ncbi:MAG: hypothetical protein ACLU3I_12655 [Acutalibacteraceae bacterium]